MLVERHLYVDNELEIEHCKFINLPQSFPSHCHDYYVLGMIIKGKRQLTCHQQVSELVPGDLFVLNPYDPHACAQIGPIPLDYQCLHISKERMKALTGTDIIFTENVVQSLEAKKYLTLLCDAILNQENKSIKEELVYLLLNELPTTALRETLPLSHAQKKTVQRASSYINSHYQNKITLDDLAKETTQNKFTLIRHFLKATGLTPYQYLETIRVTKAKELLKKQNNLLDISFHLGYVDQSHFTNSFKKITGLTPKTYQKTHDYHT